VPSVKPRRDARCAEYGAGVHKAVAAIAAADVRQAADNIQEVVLRTPVLHSRTLDGLLGAEGRLKMENFQRGGSFKIRGAYNKMAGLSAQELARGVVASSSGNHAQAVAIAAALVGTHATIVMPTDAIPEKVEATREYGATIVPCDRALEDLEERAISLAEELGCALIHPFDDPLVIAGQGTATLELLEEVDELEVLLVPIGGGGLIAGGAVIAADVSPRTRVIGVEPAGADDTKRSLAAGKRIRHPAPRSIADGQLVPCPGVQTFALISRFVDEILLVEDADIKRAMRILFERLKVVVEPSGASAVAAALRYGPDLDAARIGILVSGGNVSAQRFGELMQT
jgi:threonine dehydratase